MDRIIVDMENEQRRADDGVETVIQRRLSIDAEGLSDDEVEAILQKVAKLYEGPVFVPADVLQGGESL